MSQIPRKLVLVVGPEELSNALELKDSFLV
jgi:hypothetical protein